MDFLKPNPEYMVKKRAFRGTAAHATILAAGWTECPYLDCHGYVRESDGRLFFLASYGFNNGGDEFDFSRVVITANTAEGDFLETVCADTPLRVALGAYELFVK